MEVKRIGELKNPFFSVFVSVLVRIKGKQGLRSGESTRLPPLWPGFDSRTQHHMWVEFVVGSRRCSKRFVFGNTGFPLSSKFQFDLHTVGEEPPTHLLHFMDLSRSFSIDIYCSLALLKRHGLINEEIN